MAKLTTIQVDRDTSEKLALVAAVNRRSKSAQFAFMVDTAYREVLAAKVIEQISSITALPHPPDGTPVPLVTIQKTE